MQDPVSVKDVQNLIRRVAAVNRFIPRAAERRLPFFQVLRSSSGLKLRNKLSKNSKTICQT
jgi:hypothetical protein